MSTITKEFTKEQLVEHLRTRIEHRKGLIASMHIDRGYRDYLKLELRSSEIALASLEAEAVCVIDQSNLDYLKSGSDADVWPASRTEMGDVLLYHTAPPAPVSVPTFEEWCELTERKPIGWVRDAMKEAYDACRAAMLQGAAGNSPVIPDEVLSAVRKVARIRSDFNDFDGDRRGIGDCLDEAEQELIVTINRHASAIAAAPQQEVKS